MAATGPFPVAVRYRYGENGEGRDASFYGLSFDRSSGGSEPPYTGHIGEPIDWEAAHVTEEGFFKDGYVIDLYVDCTTGMVSSEVYGRRWDWRELSGRALVVHGPAEACKKEGFTPDF